MSEVLKNPILRFNEQLEEDDSVINDELYSYYPESGTQLNNSGNITIRVNNTDNFYLPSESSLEFEGQIQTTTGAAFESGALITFVNYGLLHLFDLVKYTLNGSPIFLNHFETVASVIDSPSVGTINSTDIFLYPYLSF